MTKQYDQWLPATDERARIVNVKTGKVYEGVAYGVIHYWGGGWSLALMTDAGESTGITDEDVRAGRKRLEPVK